MRGTGDVRSHYLVTDRSALNRFSSQYELLSHCFEQHNCDCGREVQAARLVHRDSDGIADVGREQILGQPSRFPSENEEITTMKFHIVISPFRFRSQEKISRLRRLCPLQVVEGIPQSHVQFIPIIEAGAFQLSIVQGEPEWLYQMERRLRRQTKPPDVACVWRNLRLDQDNIKTRSIHRFRRFARMQNESGDQESRKKQQTY